MGVHCHNIQRDFPSFILNYCSMFICVFFYICHDSASSLSFSSLVTTSWFSISEFKHLRSEQRRSQNVGVRLSIKLIKKQIQTAFIDHFLHASPLARNPFLVCSCNILTSRKACPYFIDDKSSSERLSNLL